MIPFIKHYNTIKTVLSILKSWALELCPVTATLPKSSFDKNTAKAIFWKIFSFSLFWEV